MRFRFELDAVDEIEGWGEPGDKSLSWYGLSSGRYWIETAAGELLRYTGGILKLWGIEGDYADYQVARLFEDLQEHLPAILEAVPADIAQPGTDSVWLARLDRWAESDAADWDLYESAMSWLWERELDTAYLRAGPRIHVWRVGTEIHFRWNTKDNDHEGVPIFTAPDGEVVLPVATFEQAAGGFCLEVLASMRERIERITQEGWHRSDCRIDLDGLRCEQRQRETLLQRVLSQRSSTDWQAVRSNLETLRSRIA